MQAVLVLSVLSCRAAVHCAQGSSPVANVVHGVNKPRVLAAGATILGSSVGKPSP